METSISSNKRRSRNVYPIRHTISQKDKDYCSFTNNGTRNNRRASGVIYLGPNIFNLSVVKANSRNQSFDFTGVTKYFNASSCCADYGRNSFNQNFKPNVSTRAKRSPHYAHHIQKSALATHYNFYKLRNSSVTANHFTKDSQLYQRCIEEGKGALERKEYEKAQSLFLKASKLNPYEMEPLLYKGITLMYENKLQEAIESLNAVIKGNSSEKSKTAYVLLAMINKKMGNIENAITILNETLKKYKNHYKALIYRGKLLAEKNYWVKAKEDFEAALKIEETTNNYWALFDCEYHLKHYKEAIAAYSKAIGIDKNVPVKSNVVGNDSEVELYKGVDED